MSFEPITTQEDFDAKVNSLIRDRIARDREAQEKKFSKEHEELLTKISGYEKQIADYGKQLEGLAAKDAEIEQLKQTNAKYETDSVKTRLAIAAGLDPKAWSYIGGTTEAEITESIKGLTDLVKAPAAPPATTEPSTQPDARQAALRQMLSGLRSN